MKNLHSAEFTFAGGQGRERERKIWFKSKITIPRASPHEPPFWIARGEVQVPNGLLVPRVPRVTSKNIRHSYLAIVNIPLHTASMTRIRRRFFEVHHVNNIRTSAIIISRDLRDEDYASLSRVSRVYSEKEGDKFRYARLENKLNL